MSPWRHETETEKKCYENTEKGIIKQRLHGSNISDGTAYEPSLDKRKKLYDRVEKAIKTDFMHYLSQRTITGLTD